MREDPEGQKEYAQKRAIDNCAVNPWRRFNLPRYAHGLSHAHPATVIEPSASFITIPLESAIRATTLTVSRCAGIPCARTEERRMLSRLSAEITMMKSGESPQ